MRNLQLNPKFLSLIFVLFLFLPSCNHEEVFVIEESAIVEEVPVEETPNTEDTTPVIPVDVVDDSFTTTENMAIEMVLHANDVSLPSSGTFSNTEPGNGLLAINDNGTPDNPLDDLIVYTPNPGFSGIDSFEYTICNASQLDNCDTAIVSITVEPIADDIATELKAFPSAVGAGAYTTGGRGGVVVHVTNLNNSGLGSFREAMNMTVPRIIVFDVSGVITLTNNLGMYSQHSNVTIAGQTAPEGGITIDGDRIYSFGVNNLICRYIRFKGGGLINNDSASISGNIENHVWDHCTFGFGTDEGASFYSGNADGTNQNKITIQRCLWNENKKGSIIGKVTSNTGDTPTISFLFNMFYNSGYRFPNIASNGAGQFDVINNVTWNVSNRLIRANGGFKLNHIGNYYDYGTTAVTDTRTNLFGFGTIPQIYNSNNKFIGSDNSPLTYTTAEMTLDGDKSWGFFQDGGGYTYGDRLPSNYFVSTQHTLLGEPFTILTADEALISVRENVGCNARLNADGSVSDNLDTLDANALNQVASGNYVNEMSTTNYIVPSITSVTRPAGYDTDQDGMPDTWETANGYNPSINDSAEDRDGDGYTNLEEFLNQVDK
jgi:hypothetical protein